MHYSNQRLEEELQKIPADPSEVPLPDQLPAYSLDPLPEVEAFVQEYRHYQEQTADLDIGTY